MLPTITIDHKSICPDGKHFSGTAFLFDWHAVIQASINANLSLDKFLTIRLGSFIQQKKYKVPILIQFSNQSGSFKLLICSKSNLDFTACLHRSSGMPGYLDYGDESIEANTKGFLYYTGTELVRIYQLSELPSKETLYCSDFGNGFGLTVSEAEQEFYEELQTSPTEHADYSFVPDKEVEQIVTPQNTLQLKHAFVHFKN